MNSLSLLKRTVSKTLWHSDYNCFMPKGTKNPLKNNTKLMSFA